MSLKYKKSFRDNLMKTGRIIFLLVYLISMFGGSVISVQAAAVTVEGSSSSGTADDVSSIAFAHTSGTGTDRLMLVGVSWNSGSSESDIQTVTFSYGTTELPMTVVIDEQATSTTAPRNSAIYSLLNPPAGEAGTVTVTFSGAVSNGIVAGATNFAGVNQTTPLGTPGGATATSSTNPTITLTGLNGDELVFDNVFQGASGETQTLTTGANQTEQWNGWIANTRAAASTEQAASDTVTMSWTASASSVWVIAAVPINPATSGTTYDLTMATDGNGTTTPAVGTHTYAENQIVAISATPSSGYVFDSWTGDADCADGSVTMDADKSCTATFVEVPIYPDGAISSETADDVSSISFAHTTGTGANRITLVAVSWNSFNDERTISSVTFSYDTTETPLTEVISRRYDDNNRYSAIYSLLNPPSGQAGTVTITFSDSVSSGIVAGAANFAGVSQTTPTGPTGGADASSTAPSVTLTGLDGDELVFDSVFYGGQIPVPALTADSSQTEFWNETEANTRGTTSTKYAGGNTSVSMDWSTGTSSIWVSVAVALNPVTAGTTYDLTMASDGNGTTTPAAGTHTYAENQVVGISATPSSGYVFDSWTGDPDCTDGSVTMDADKTCTANFVEAPPSGEVVLDGAVSSETADGVSSISFAHTTGTGVNRLTMVGVSWNCGTSDQTISSVTFSYGSGPTVMTLDPVFTQQAETQLRYSAIYSLEAPPQNQAGTVTVTFSGSVGNGIVAGAANFAGVNQTAPLGIPDGDGSGTNDTAPSVTLTGLNGDELVFDNVFQGASDETQTLTAGSGQSQLWNAWIGNTRAAASTEQAAGSSVTMSWTASSASYWAIAAVPINPAPLGTTYDLTMASDGNGTTNPAVGVHTYAENTTVGISATPNSGFVFSSWSGDADCADGSVTMNADKTCTANFTGLVPDNTIVLGRPTDNSVTVNAIVGTNGQVRFEYGPSSTTSGSYPSQTSTQTATAGEPVEVVIGSLAANTQYFYRLNYRATVSDPWAAGDEYSFRTQRAAGSTFSFTITSDSHLGQTFSGNDPARHNQTTLNVAADHPDFNLDLGDAFVTSLADDQAGVDELYLNQRPYFGNFTHSAPMFLVIGNHENEEGWNLDDTPFSRGLASIIARKEYYPNPTPDSFYSGNSDLLSTIGGDQLREDYYAWEWGDALFVVLDPFQYTPVKPYGTITGSGEEDDETVIGDQWDWTLGQTQYDWFKETLENSDATFKFVFAHHVVGGQLEVTGAAGAPGYVRGGGLAAPYFEWGGFNADDTWGFDTERSGWGGNSIHQLMLANGVAAFFHGHDHQYVHEVVDGIVYQEVPSTGMTGYGFDLYDDSPYVVSGGNLPSPGHILVTVSPTQATVEYVRSAISGDTGVTNGAIEHPYTITPPTPPDCYTLTLSHSGEGTDPVASPANSSGCLSGQYVAGEVITLSDADPASGWEISGWTGTNDDSSIEDNNTVNMPASIHTASVIYSEIPTCYALTLSHTGEGTDPVASPTNSTGCSADTYVAGEIITLSGAIPESGWHISGWTGTDSDSSTLDTNIVTMPADARAASVIYSEIPPTCYALTLSHSGEGTDPVAFPTNSSGCSADTYVAGESITLSGAVPESGWEISGWTGTNDDSSTEDTNTFNMPASEYAASVIYSEISAPTCYTLTLSHTGEGSDPVALPTNSIGCLAGTYVEDEIITLSADPASGWEISSWTGTDLDSSTAITNTVTMPASDRDASVIYSEISAPTCYALTLSHTGEGSDPVASPLNSTGCLAGTYVEDEIITLSGADPDSGWEISGWSGTDDDTSIADNNKVTMPASAHSASVIYRSHTFIPLLFNSTMVSSTNVTHPIAGVIGSVLVKSMMK